MKMIKSYLPSLCTFLWLFLILVAIPSFSIQTSFGKHLLGSKEGHKIEGLDRVRQYLIKYGYMNSGSLPQQRENLFDDNLSDAVKKYQRFFHLDSSGILDEKTLAQMAMPRCGMPDFVNGTEVLHSTKLVRYRSNGSYYAFEGTKWRKFNLTWGVRPGTRQDAQRPITTALSKWASVSKFHFYPGARFEGSDLMFSFFSGAHGDNSPFTGPKGVLAHSFAPPSGKVHFNADVNWADGAVAGAYDIGSVALHEIGHLLGLDHSTVQAAAMWPTTPPGTIKGLHPDDIAGIQALYR